MQLPDEKLIFWEKRSLANWIDREQERQWRIRTLRRLGCTVQVEMRSGSSQPWFIIRTPDDLKPYRIAQVCESIDRLAITNCMIDYRYTDPNFELITKYPSLNPKGGFGSWRFGAGAR
jgi:hypothetical protein